MLEIHGEGVVEIIIGLKSAQIKKFHVKRASSRGRTVEQNITKILEENFVLKWWTLYISVLGHRREILAVIQAFEKKPKRGENVRFCLSLIKNVKEPLNILLLNL